MGVQRLSDLNANVFYSKSHTINPFMLLYFTHELSPYS